MKKRYLIYIMLWGIIQGLFIGIIVNGDIYINPADEDGINFNLGPEFGSYTLITCFDQPTNVSRIVFADDYLVFNDTGFNITGVFPTIIKIIHIDDDIQNPVDTYEDLVSFKMMYPLGGVHTFNISGFTNVNPHGAYWLLKNNNTLDSGSFNDAGYVKWTSSYDYGDVFRIRSLFTTNELPAIAYESPENQSTGDAINVSLSAYIFDADEPNLNWEIKSNATGDWSILSAGTEYYAGWIWANTTDQFTKPNTRYWWSVNVSDDTNYTNSTYYFDTVDYIDAPTGLTVNYWSGVKYLNISWDLHFDDGQDSYVVIKRADSFATSVNQSGNTVERNISYADKNQFDENTTNKAYYNFTTENIYVTLFSWNESADIYSYNSSTPLGTNVPWGGMEIVLYNESDNTDIIYNWSIEITNSNTGLVEYYNETVPEKLYLSRNDITFTDNMIFYISADDYQSRIFYKDLVPNKYYYEKWYLPQTEGENASKQYRVRVIDDYSYPVEGAEILVQKYMNETGGMYRNMTQLLTDGYGEADSWLIPGVHYRVVVSKTGFDTATFDWIPDPDYYGANYPKIFQIYRTGEEYTNETDCAEIITFTGEFDGTTLYVNYTDSTGRTTNVSVYVYELNHTTHVETLLSTTNVANDSTVGVTEENLDTNNTFYIILYWTHPDCGSNSMTYIYQDGGWIYGIDTDEDDLNTLLDNLFKSNPFLWTNIGGLFLVMLCLFAFGEQFRGISIMLAGGMLLTVNALIGLALIGVTVPIVFIFLGFLVQWNVRRRTS